VHAGVRDPLLKLDPIHWPGHEGVGLLQDDDDLAPADSTDAVDYLVETVLAHPGEITLLAVGPLTNVATAILREPTFAGSLRQLTIMGGKVDMSNSSWGPGEHNIKCDPEAASVVFRSGAHIDLVPLDVTLRALIRQPGVDALMTPITRPWVTRSRGTPDSSIGAGPPSCTTPWRPWPWWRPNCSAGSHTTSMWNWRVASLAP
jgi:inosine-uridine nucleoside N-ribohydrolase